MQSPLSDSELRQPPLGPMPIDLINFSERQADMHIGELRRQLDESFANVSPRLPKGSGRRVFEIDPSHT